jgi:hypothetical protein
MVVRVQWEKVPGKAMALPLSINYLAQENYFKLPREQSLSFLFNCVKKPWCK